MDLHVVAPLASPAEREAVDAVLTPRIGPPQSGWRGGTRDMATEGHVARGGHEARAHATTARPSAKLMIPAEKISPSPLADGR